MLKNNQSLVKKLSDSGSSNPPKMKNKRRLFQLKGGLMVPVEEEAKLTPKIIRSTIDRKTITIHETEYKEWLKMKEEHNWTTLLKTVREGYQFFKKVMENLTVKVTSGYSPTERVGRHLERIPSSVNIPKIDPNSPKAQVLAEIKKATEGKMSVEEFRKSLLKPLTEEELGNIQKSEEELDKAQKKNKELRLEDLTPPN